MSDQSIQLRLHEDHRAIFIHGLGGEKDSREKQALDLSMWIYQHPPGAGSKITAIENNAQQPEEVDDKSHREVLSYLTQDFMLDHKEGEIRLVLFCHSNGVKLTRKALQTESLQSALKQKYPAREHGVLFLMKIIRSNTAVVTFGGVSLISEDLAKLVLNFRYENDNFSQICHYIGFGNHGEPNAYYRVPVKPDKKEQLPKSWRSWFSNSMNCGIEASSQRLSENQKSSSSDGLSSDNPHYLENYLASKVMIDYIIKMLGLPNRY